MLRVEDFAHQEASDAIGPKTFLAEVSDEMLRIYFTEECVYCVLGGSFYKQATNLSLLNCYCSHVDDKCITCKRYAEMVEGATPTKKELGDAIDWIDRRQVLKNAKMGFLVHDEWINAFLDLSTDDLKSPFLLTNLRARLNPYLLPTSQSKLAYQRLKDKLLAIAEGYPYAYTLDEKEDSVNPIITIDSTNISEDS